MLLFLATLACFTDLGPCEDYCNYICECHAGERGYDCDQCRTEYSEVDPALEDECETSLLDLRTDDEANGTGCVDEVDTGA